jgi:hypothetical protein
MVDTEIYMTSKKETIVFRGKLFQNMLLVALIGGMLYFVLNIIVLQSSLIDSFSSSLGIMVGFVIGFYLIYRSKRLRLLVSANAVEGPVRWSPFKRIAAPLNDINIDESRLPTMGKDGYLQLSDGVKIC